MVSLWVLIHCDPQGGKITLQGCFTLFNNPTLGEGKVPLGALDTFNNFLLVF
jgi:hypothetical protein